MQELQSQQYDKKCTVGWFGDQKNILLPFLFEGDLILYPFIYKFGI